MEKLTLEEIREAVGGRLYRGKGKAGPGPEAGKGPGTDACADAGQVAIRDVVTDSRKITEGCIFFALSGDRFDGHAFVEAALAAGAAACVVERLPEPDGRMPGKFYVQVPDARRALGDLAHFYRMKMGRRRARAGKGLRVVAITGSVGKTTCCGMVAAVLARRYRVHATAGNFNNDIGLPMTIFGLSGEDEALVLEMGMNHPGEIRRLARIAAPDLAVITNIGTAHIGNLGSRENIFAAKKEIFEGLRPGGCAVLCGDDDFLPRIAREPSLAETFQICYAGKSGICSYRVEDVEVEASMAPPEAVAAISTRCRIAFPSGRILEARIPAVGRHLAWPASMAAAVGDLMGLVPEEIAAGLADFRGQRMACEQIGGVLLFDDAYNASPDSMASSLDALACMPARKKVAVLGDMLEQGDYAEALHREVGAAAARAGMDALIAIGPLSAAMADEARKRGLADVRHFEERDGAADAVRGAARPGTALLFKASHGMELGKLAAVAREEAGAFLPG